MLIIPRLKSDGSLTLDAYSFSSTEIEAVTEVLSSAKVAFSSEELPIDKQGRIGRSYIVQKSDVPQLETYLRVRFIGLETRTTVEFREETAQSYRCEELAVNGMGKGCVNLTARRNSEATMKCALIAHDRGWLGGVASPGKC